MNIRLREYRGDIDLQTMTDVANSAARMDLNASMTDVQELKSDLSAPGINPERGIVIAELADHVVGFVVLMIVEDQAGSPVVHVNLKCRPDAGAEVERTLIEVALARSKETALLRCRPTEVFLPIDEAQSERRTVAADLGFVATRYFFRMTASLASEAVPTDIPPGFTLRKLSGLDELTNWVDLFNESFVDHWHFTPMSVDRARHFAANDPNYCTDGDLVALASDGTFAAFCQCVIRKSENALTGRREGWISLLGTRRGYRRRGLGSLMLREGMKYLRLQGMNAVHLGVDSDSPTGAVSLYERAGFSISNRRTAFLKVIDK